MNNYSSISRSIWYCFLNAFLVFLMVFFLLPAATPRVNADSDNVTSENISSDNLTFPNNISDNITFPDNIISSDNITPDDDLNTSDNVSDDSTSDETLTDAISNIKPNKKIVKSGEETDVLSSNGKVKLHIPKGATKESIAVELIEKKATGTIGTQQLKFLDLNAFGQEAASDNKSEKKPGKTNGKSQEEPIESDNSTSDKFTSKKNNFHFEKEISLSIIHTPEELAGLDIESLHLYYLDEGTHQWVAVADTFDKETLTLTASISHFSYYGEHANPLQSGPGRVMASDVDLHSGAASYSYPIELPPGPGGFQPSLALTYNSGSVDGMKNKRDVGSWVGIGWNLHFGRISYSAATYEYYLDLNGSSYKLVSTDGISFQTQPEQYFKITRSGDTWHVYDKDGNYFRFGDTADAKQFNDGSIYYRWDLSYWKDPNNNDATISYVRDMWLGSVRSAYPEFLRYNNNAVEVHFFSNYYQDGSDGPVRLDNPISYGNNPVPKNMETRQLNSIEIKVNTNLIRKYNFSYDTTGPIFSSDHNGTYYAGKHTLKSISQQAVDGISLPLPATNFNYEVKSVYRITNETQYSGNPGNPTSLGTPLAWPFLTQIESGYGGSVSFAYTQKPDPSVLNCWSRQAVTQKTISSGIGTDEIHYYSYTGNPAYSGTGWDQEFRGWNEVREADAAGNYILHYFYTIEAIKPYSDFLKGKEYSTKWYQAGSPPALLRETNNTWTYEQTLQGEGYYLGDSSIPAQSVAVSPDGYVYASNANDFTVKKYDANLSYISTIDTFSQYNQAKAIGVSTDGYIYVGCTGHNGSNYVSCIKKYDSSGNLITTFGNSQLTRVVTDLAVSGDHYRGGAVYVIGYADFQSSIIYKFDLNGQYISEYAFPYSYASGMYYFHYAYGITVAPNGLVYAAAQYLGSVPGYWGGLIGSYKFEIAPDLSAYNSTLISAGHACYGLASAPEGTLYMTFCGYYNYIKNLSTGSQYGNLNDMKSIDVGPFYIYVANGSIHRYTRTFNNWRIKLDRVDETTYSSAAAEPGGNWLSSWNYRKQMTISGSAGAQTNYQLKLNVSKNSGTDSGSTVYLNGHCKSDFSDLRFTRSDGTTLLDYWIESYTSDTSAVVWVEFDSIPASTTASFYLYYGNQNVTSASNGTNTFVIFDDFERGVNGDPIGGNWLDGRAGAKISTDHPFSGSPRCLIIPGSANGLSVMHFFLIYDTNIAIGFKAWKEDAGGFAFIVGNGSQLLWVCPHPDETIYYPNDDRNCLVSTGGVMEKDTWQSMELYNVNFTAGTGLLQVQGGIPINIPNAVPLTYYAPFVCLAGDNALGSAYGSGNDAYVDDYFVRKYIANGPAFNSWGSEELKGVKTTRTSFAYDGFGNVTTQYVDGDFSTTTDDSVIHKEYYPNLTTNILSKVAREWITDSSGTVKDTRYYYDGNTAYNMPPLVNGNLTRTEQINNVAPFSISSTFTYFTNGNLQTSWDANNIPTTFDYDTILNAYPAHKIMQLIGTESYYYEWNWSQDGYSGVMKVTVTDVNGNPTVSYYDTYDRLWKVIRPGDTFESPSILYVYNNWGAINQQNIETRTKTSDGIYLWQKQYFDGLGRVIQTQNSGEPGHTIISSTTTFNSRGLVDKQYVSQDIGEVLASYQSPDIDPVSGWKYSTTIYDALGRVTTQTGADGVTITHNYSIAWQDTVTNARGINTHYSYDAFSRLIRVIECNSDNSTYATTDYAYDALGNLTDVWDSATLRNHTQMTYDMLSRKTGMTDPDMGAWTYGYDNNGNLISQRDAKNQTVTMDYDALNRLYHKGYSDPTMSSVTYLYDDTTSGNYGKGRRTSMEDGTGNTDYKYDERGRLIEEKRIFPGSGNFTISTTTYEYDSADRNIRIHYPTGEVVTQTYNGRGMPDTLSGTIAGTLVSDTQYNQLGAITQINLGNGLKTTYGYYGTGGAYDTTGGYYGRLWEIKTLPQAGGTPKQDIQYDWDAAGNLSHRTDVVSGEATENFFYDSLDRILAVTGPYNESYAYDTIGNIVSRGVNSYYYTDPDHKHAVKSIVTPTGTTYYDYDANGNMETVTNAALIKDYAWDSENRLTSVSENGTVVAQFFYDGDGKRVKKNENGITTVYVNKYYEFDIVAPGVTGNVTSSYYLGGRLIAQSENGTLSYVHQDSLSSTSLMTDSYGVQIGTTIKFLPFGEARATIDIPTDKLFTGQRLDATGLYYYGARYYDPTTGRFLSPDGIAPDLDNPQSFNKYSYCFNNPLKYIDPTGHWPKWSNIWGGMKNAAQTTVNFVKENIDSIQTGLDVLGMIPVVGEAFDAVNGVIYAARGDALNAGLSFAACIPVAGTAATGAKLLAKGLDKGLDVVKGAERAVERGKEGLKLAGITQNTERITSLTGTANFRIPDGLDRTANLISEVKNVKYQGLTSQIQDYAMWANNKGFTFELVTRPDTKLSKPLQKYMKDYNIMLRTW